MYTQIMLVLMAAFVMTSSAQTGPTVTMETEIMTSVVFENGTTIEMTTASMPPTTPPGPTPCAAADWIIRDSNSAVCMLMSFSGNITYKGNKYDISNTTSTQNSDCSEQAASFNLYFIDIESEMVFHIVLKFSSEGKKYELSAVTVEVFTMGGVLVASSTIQTMFFSVPTGKHYMCEDFEFNLGTFDLALSSPVLQPFVLKTKDQCGLGEACECGDCDGSSTNTGLIVGCVIAGLVVAAAGGYMIYVVIRRNKKKSYSQM